MSRWSGKDQSEMKTIEPIRMNQTAILAISWRPELPNLNVRLLSIGKCRMLSNENRNQVSQTNLQPKFLGSLI